MTSDQTELPKMLRESVLSILQQFRGHRVVYFVDEAAVTDRLAHFGTLAAMHRSSILYHLASSVEEVDAHTSANSVRTAIICNSVSDAAKLQNCGAEFVVVLPRSDRWNPELMGGLREHVLLLCRDLMTLQSLRILRNAPSGTLAHDMAFHLNIRKILTDEQTDSAARDALVDALDRNGTSLDEIAGHERISIFQYRDFPLEALGAPRVHLESVVAELQHDLGIRAAVWGFLRVLSYACGVTTDSTEVAIGCALLGVDCELLGELDGESASVFETSLSLFENVRFVPYGSATMRARGADASIGEACALPAN